MKKEVYILLLLMVGYFARGQEISILRTDVDSSRSSFVTATYNFSFKVYVKDVKNCTAVSFVLRHNQTEYIKFSNYRTLLFSKDGSAFVYPWYNPMDGYERIYTGILNGDTIGGKGGNNPEVIEFEFSVAADAPYNSILELYFEDAEAVVSDSGVGKIVKLKSTPILLNIHSFVQVWPGDANNDGVVNINDVSSVALYLGYGSQKPNFRAFQRLNASTNWFGQTCLAWDSLAVTFADCDGDGEVTINDMLVIPLNFGKTHQVKNIIPNSKEQNESEISLISHPHNIPLAIVANEPVVGFVGEIEPTESFELYNLNASSQSTFYTRYKTSNGQILLCGSTIGLPINNQIICTSNRKVSIYGKGITNEGKIIDAELVPISTLSYSSSNENELFDEDIQYPAQVSIFNLIGEKLSTKDISSPQDILFEIEKLNNGLYLIQILSGQKILFTKITKW